MYFLWFHKSNNSIPEVVSLPLAPLCRNKFLHPFFKIIKTSIFFYCIFFLYFYTAIFLTKIVINISLVALKSRICVRKMNTVISELKEKKRCVQLSCSMQYIDFVKSKYLNDVQHKLFSSYCIHMNQLYFHTSHSSGNDYRIHHHVLRIHLHLNIL